MPKQLNIQMYRNNCPSGREYNNKWYIINFGSQINTEAVLDLQVFNFRTARTVIRYRFSPPNSLLYNEYGLLCTADEQTSHSCRVVLSVICWPCHHFSLCVCVCGLGNIIVFTQPCLFLHKTFFKQHINHTYLFSQQ